MKRVPAEKECTILRHHLVDKWPVGTVAKQVGVHHDVVRRVIAQHGMPVPVIVTRHRVLDPYVDFLQEVLQKYPKLRSSRLFQMVRERGYAGSASHLRREVAGLRPKPPVEPFLRLTKLPAEEAQVDWACFGTVKIRRATRKLYAFVMTLSWSRGLWLQFFFDMQMPSFLKGHLDAFSYFGGVPRKLLYDNLKSAVIERDGNAIRYNDRLLELANHYGFEPRAAAPRRGNEKGVVERSIRYIRDNFFAAREFHSLERLNAEAREWLSKCAEERKWPTDERRLVFDVLREERERLRQLPADTFPIHERKRIKVARTPYIRIDLNDYSVPARCVRTEIDALIEPERIRIAHGDRIVAEHKRCFDRRAVIEAPEHVEEVRAYKRQAERPSAGATLRASVPSTELFLTRAAERGQNLGNLVSRLMVLLSDYGPEHLEEAVVKVNERNVVNTKSVLILLEQNERAKNRKMRLPVRLARKELEDVSVRKADLSLYGPPQDDENSPSDEELF